MVAPAGGTMAKHDNWKNGVGRVMERVGDVGAQVVLARLDGTVPRDAARMFFHPALSARRPLDLQLRFSEPIPLETFRPPGAAAKDISLLVREEYVRRYGSL